MTPVGIRFEWTYSHEELPASNEPQIIYALLEAMPQGSAAVSASSLPLNLCLVIDRSSSMRGDRLIQVKEAAQRIVDQLGRHDYFALITFNDHADIVIPSQRVLDKTELKYKIGTIDAAGGTEMATGLALAAQEMQRSMMGRSISRMLLLTDGRTYGDESRCVQIVRRSQERQIGLTALGIGHEWNEDLLETMAAHENSRAHYITSAAEIARVFGEEVERMHSIFAQGVQLHIRLRPGGILRSLDRIQPFIAPVPIIEQETEYWSGKLGDWPSNDAQMFLLELVVPPLDPGEHPLAQVVVRYDLPNTNAQPQPIQSKLDVQVRSPQEIAHPHVNSLVKHWLERLVAYRLQARAWKEAADGDIKSATKRLEMASTRLFESGQDDLAHAIEREAIQMARSGNTSAVGRKQIKYGTRGLMGKDPAS
jgi:Mg-chelatase subunit ChlD